MAVNKSGELVFKLPATDVLRIFTKTFKDDDYEVEIEDEDPEKKEVRINAISSEMLRKYKTYKVTATITPNDDGESSRVKWSLESEKNPDYIHDDPHSFINTESKTVEFHRWYLAEDLFAALMARIEEDDEVEVEYEDPKNMATMIKLICTGLLQTFRAFIDVTPTAFDDCHVGCIVDYEKIPDEYPVLSLVTAAYFVQIIGKKLLA